MTHQNELAMSVILVTPDCYETIRQITRHLRAQVVKHQLQIIIVAPSARTLHLKGYCNLGQIWPRQPVELLRRSPTNQWVIAR